MMIFLLYFSLYHLVNGKITMNQSAAVEHCRLHGGLISYQDFINNRIAGQAFPKENDSKWILGYANFSNFFKWQGCYDEKDINFIKKEIIQKNNIYNCSLLCNSHNNASVGYIGLKGKSCFCMPYLFLNKEVINRIPEAACQQQRLEPLFLYPKNIQAEPLHVSVFSVVEYGRFHWLKEQNDNFSLCVFSKHTGNLTAYGKKSCIDEVNALICEGSAISKLSDNCSAEFNGSYCVIFKVSNWFQAADHCNKYSGKLAYISPTMQKSLKEGEAYWTGIFRSYKIVTKIESTGPEIACLAATKVGDSFIVHPDNCSVEKEPLCVNASATNTSVTWLTQYENVETTVSGYEYNTVTYDKLPTPEASNIKSGLILICVAILIAVILIVVCVLIVIMRKKISSKKEKQDNSNEHNETVEENALASINDNAIATKTINIESEKTFNNSKEASVQDSETEVSTYDVLISGQGHKPPTANLSVCADVHVYGYHSRGHGDTNDVYDRLGDSNKQRKGALTGEYSTMRDVLTGTSSVYGMHSGCSVQSGDKRTPKEGFDSLYDKLK